MLQAMLADRFKLVAHVEKREQPVFELPARSDGKLGAGPKPSENNCAEKLATDRVATEAALNAGTQPPRPQIPNRDGRRPVHTESERQSDGRRDKDGPRCYAGAQAASSSIKPV
jgi:uncharacterized protein (TIGR03435 family)